MPPKSTVHDLAMKVLQAGDGGLLATPLGELGPMLPDDAARECMRDFEETGLAVTLGEALQGGLLDAFASESCTQREEESLCRGLLALLGDGLGAVGDDDPARLVVVKTPPRAPGLFAEWAWRHGLVGFIEEQAVSVLGEQAEDMGGGTIGELWLAPTCRRPVSERPQRSLLALDHQATDLQTVLVHRAKRSGAVAARSALWQGEVVGGDLTQLVQRLRGLLVKRDVETLCQVVFVPSRPVTIELSSGVAEGYPRTPSQGQTRVRLFLAGYEQRGLIGDCDDCGEGTCDHVLALGGRLLDGALMPDDRLHGPLLEYVSEPSWKSFLAAMDPPAIREAAQAPRGKLSFRLVEDGVHLRLTVFAHRRAKAGGFSEGKRLSLTKVSRSTLVAEVDREALELLNIGARPLSTGTVIAEPPVLRALCGHPEVYFGVDARHVGMVESTLEVDFREQGDGVSLEASLSGIQLRGLSPTGVQRYLYRLDDAANLLVFCSLPAPSRRLLRALSTYRGILPKESFGALGPIISELRKVVRLKLPSVLMGLEYPASDKLLLRLANGPGDALILTLTTRPLPLGPLFDPAQGPELVHGLVDGNPVHARRNFDAERSTASKVLGSVGADALTRLAPFAFKTDDPQQMLATLSEIAKLGDQVDIEWSERSRRPTLSASIKASDLQVRLFAKGQWLQAEGGVVRADMKIALGRLFEASKRGERFVRVSGNTYAEIEGALRERLEIARLCVHEFGAKEGSQVLAGLAAAPLLLSQFAGVAEPGDEKTAKWLDETVRRNEVHAESEAAPLAASLSSVLRPYQRAGVDFLFGLSGWAPGACLADEMGLGKTLQAIALLELRRGQGAALVVAPTSVTENWCHELARFAATLTVHNYRGARRQRLLAQLGPGHVLVVSYDVLLRDQGPLARCEFATRVLDEAQWLKNAQTQRACAVASIEAGFTVALSGTPVENRLGDLWSLMSFVAPGLLGPWARFRSLFAVPIERYSDETRAATLRSLVAPFILRRTKNEVASDLPARTEVMHRIELSPAERDLYRAANAEARESLKKRRKEDEKPVANVLANLTRLRQLACHPRLVLQQSEVESSKLAALRQILDDIIPRGHRVLIFSQFVQHLKLVVELLEQARLAYEYLDGATPAHERSDTVERFQKGDVPVFLISLKAGGVGLNLTAADYVIHLDPWWNPAAEDQASDRAHRIGQDKPVTIVKLVATGTIEERVVELHKDKRKMANQLLTGRSGQAPLDLAMMQRLLELDT